MDRSTEGKPGRVPWRTHVHGPTGFIYVRFSHAGRPVDRSTRTRDPIEAQAEARRIWESVTSGRDAGVTRGATSILEMAAAWTDAIAKSGELDPATAQVYGYFSRHWARCFGTLEQITTEAARGYGAQRLGKVLRKSVRKELSALRGFLDWCVRQGALTVAPAVPPLPRGKAGVRVNPNRKKTGTLWTRAQIRRLLKAAPVWSDARGKKRRFRLRDYLIVLYETGLRPETIALLQSPRHWDGGPELWIEEAIDKVGYDRKVPLTPAARSALKRAKDATANEAPDPRGWWLFGRHDYRKALGKLARQLGLVGLTEYDLRHSRATHLLDAGAALPGVSYLLGHTQVSTTDRYIKRSQAAARAALRRGSK